MNEMIEEKEAQVEMNETSALESLVKADVEEKSDILNTGGDEGLSPDCSK